MARKLKALMAVGLLAVTLAAIFFLVGGGKTYSSVRSIQYRDDVTVAPEIMGLFGGSPSTPHPGDTFTTSNGTWTNTPTSFTYQWEDCDGGGSNCVAISNATTSQLTVQSSDLGQTLRVVVTACNVFGCSATTPGGTSAATGLVATAGTAPTNAVAPAVSGVPSNGSVLTSSTGTWSGTPTSFTYQWQHCNLAGSGCTNIGGATSSTYTVVSGDDGFTIRVGVAATNASGTSARSFSGVTSAAGANTLGKTSIGGTCASLPADRMALNQVTFASVSTVAGFFIYLKPSGLAGQQSVEGAMYTDNGSNAPGTLVAVSSPVAITSNSAAQFYPFAFSANASAAKYWIGIFSGQNAGVAQYCYDTVSNSRDYAADTFSTGAHATFGTPTIDSQSMSDYVTYTAQGVNPIPSVPQNLQAAPGDTTAALTWNASTCSGCTLSGYQIFRNGTKVATTAATNFTDTGLTNNTTYTYTVAAFDSAGDVSAQSGSVLATPQSGGGGGGGGVSGAACPGPPGFGSTATSCPDNHLVPTTPDQLPSSLTPTGGWSVEYADAFGNCNYDTGTLCTGNYPRGDQSFAPETGTNCDGNSNEICGYQKNEVNVTSNGLELRCDNVPTGVNAYSCGGLTGVSAPKHYVSNYFKSGDIFAIQWAVQSPPNTGEMDSSFWSVATPYSASTELDHPEQWGYGWQAGAADGSGWCGGPGTARFQTPNGIGHIAGKENGQALPVLASGGGVTGLFCSTPCINFDPSLQIHYGTMYWNGSTESMYYDGHLCAQHVFTSNEFQMRMRIEDDMRGNHNWCPSSSTNCHGRTDSFFPAQGVDYFIHYVAVYEAKSDNHADSIGPMIEPGTSCTTDGSTPTLCNGTGGITSSSTTTTAVAGTGFTGTCDKTINPSTTSGAIASAESTMTAGQTLCLNSGTYGSTSGLNIYTKAGSSGSPITITSGPGQTATIVGAEYVNAAFITLEFLNIDDSNNQYSTNGGSDPAPCAIPVSESLDVNANNVTLQDNNIYQATAALRGVLIGIGYSGQVNNTVIRFNKISDAGSCNQTQHLVYDAHGSGAQIDHNWMWNDHNGYAVQLFSAPGGDQVYSNVFDGALDDLIDDSSVGGNSTHNNVGINSFASGSFVSGQFLNCFHDQSGTTDLVQNNAYFSQPNGFGCASESGLTISGNILLSGDPFVDSAHHNYNLANNAAATPITGYGLWDGTGPPSPDPAP